MKWWFKKSTDISKFLEPPLPQKKTQEGTDYYTTGQNRSFSSLEGNVSGHLVSSTKRYHGSETRLFDDLWKVHLLPPCECGLMAHQTYYCPSLVLSCPDREMLKHGGARDQEQVSANINASARRLSDEKQTFQRRTRGSCNEEKPKNSEWSQPRATTSFAKKCEKITQVNRLGTTQRNLHNHNKKAKSRPEFVMFLLEAPRT